MPSHSPAPIVNADERYDGDAQRVSTAYILSLMGAGAAVVVIALLSALLKMGDFSAKLLLDMSSKDQTFPYPFTVQNVMWVLLGVAFGDLYYRTVCADREYRAIETDLLKDSTDAMILPQDVERYRKRIERAKETSPGYIIEVIDECLLYFRANQSVESTQQMLNNMVDLELHRVDLNYTFLRYVAWLIPTAGFIGTVVGIAGALNHLNGGGEGMADNMDAVIVSLGMAFNTTILALCFSSVLVYLIQIAQKKEEESVNRCSQYCLKRLINRLYIPPQNRQS